MSAISILILIEKWWFSAVGAALRRDCGEAVAWDRDYNELQSPVSRSVHWVEMDNKYRTPTGFHKSHIQNALRLIHCGTPLGFKHLGDRRPSVRYATLGFGV